MKKYYFEKLDDSYINIYEEGIFVRAIEYSASEISEITDYRLYPNIDKKTGFVYLEVGFPKSQLEEVLSKLKASGFFIRYFDKNGNATLYDGTRDFKKDLDKVVELKTKMIFFK